MNLKPALRYLRKEMRTALLWYYGTIVVLAVAGYFVARYLATRYGLAGSSITFSGITGVTSFFLFITGLNSYRTELLYFLQNGISRKTLYVSLLITGAVLALLTGVLDLAIDRVGGMVLQSLNINLISINEMLMPQSSVPLLGKYLAVVVLNASGFFLGVFFTTLFYRLNTLGKVLVPVGAVLLLPALSYVDKTTGGAITLFAQQAESFSRSGILQFVLMNGIYALVIAIGIWLLQRRAQIKTNVS